MWNITFEIFYKTVFIALFLSGLLKLVFPSLIPFFNEQIKNYRHFVRLRRLKQRETVEQRKKNLLHRHLELLLQSTYKKFDNGSVYKFVILTISIFTSSSLSLAQYTGNLRYSLILGTFFSLIPYLTLRIRLFFIRSDTSYALVPAVSLFLGKYRANSRDLYHSLLDTINDLHSHNIRLAFIKLTNSFQSLNSKDDLESAVELFVYQIDNTWAKQLGILFLNAHWEGINIEKSLSNIVQDITRVQQIIQEEKSNNTDAILLGFLPIVIFIVTPFFINSTSGYGKYFHYQFETSTGLASFTIALIASSISFITSLLLIRPKNDL